MNKKLIFILLLPAIVALGALDFFVNGYADKLELKASVKDAEVITNNYVQKIQTLDKSLVLEEENATSTIFNKINLEKVEGIKSAKDFLFTKNGVNYFKLYSFEFNSKENQINYLKLKTLFSDLKTTQPNIEVNEANPYGINSFYVNDMNDENVVRVIVLTNESVFGLEYAKIVTKESIEPLLSILTDHSL